MHPRCNPDTADHRDRVRRGEGCDHRRDAGAAAGRVGAKVAYARAAERLNAIVDALDKPLQKSQSDGHTGMLEAANVSNTTPSEYARMVAQAKEYITAGDIFQVVLSQRFNRPTPCPPARSTAHCGG